MAYDSKGNDRIWVVDPSWMSLSQDTLARCRRTYERGQNRCPNKAVAQFRRSNGWWAYCEEHLYGRRFHNGHVEKSVRVDSSSALEALAEKEA